MTRATGAAPRPAISLPRPDVPAREGPVVLDDRAAVRRTGRGETR
ncbi:hypothetical protein EES43_27000 [Streptomyces sp. ADI96-02]|nr:hypothetical protein [Streptomyces sp. ADI96-02]RPK55159.1 hypothetical protein EES43_27000 [Streptomyces sp. ADI96-02]